MRTFVYVDGFNLYYGALKGTPFKWLDPVALLNRILQPRHDVYLRALQRYRPEIEVYFGHFLRHRVRAPLARPAGPQRTVEVIKTEEKGSDVNVAVHLLNDGWEDAYDCGVVVSNDSDIAEAMRLVRRNCRKRIGLVTPGKEKPSRQLLAHADFSRHVRVSALQHSQLPSAIPRNKHHKAGGLVVRSVQVSDRRQCLSMLGLASNGAASGWPACKSPGLPSGVQYRRVSDLCRGPHRTQRRRLS